ncbi:hypothetical protein [Streptomyces sp900116325]|uniref:hypothetical protein n=1 Tax=Streptomyces sp. 900116325 TaxID=3154295 RepID=UPI0033AE8FF0
MIALETVADRALIDGGYVDIAHDRVGDLSQRKLGVLTEDWVLICRERKAASAKAGVTGVHLSARSRPDDGAVHRCRSLQAPGS